ncbi:MAG: uncharacterized protein JWN48_5686 [Myxococcaceae bacterium]|nr:uncharacterized protein [Myxococcaceae bacterium]
MNSRLAFSVRSSENLRLSALAGSIARAFCVPLVVVLAACGSPRHDDQTTDMSPASATPDSPRNDGGLTISLDAAVMDAHASEAAVPVFNCETPDSGIACDDGKFCSGQEVCRPSDPAADARGCVAGSIIACGVGQTCSEQMQQCSVCSDLALDDADHDGHEARSCGGDDCRDDDGSSYPGHAEVCDGKDNDCDGAIDGAAADMGCLAAAPTGATSSCVMGSCATVCTDPDFDLSNQACVRHDDCAGVTACGPGRCSDGVRAYSCTCPSGYAGTGSTACTDIDECASPMTHSCDSTPLACVNDLGSYHCQCPSSHFGDGQGASGCILKALKVAAGALQTCAVLTGGSVKCWGSDTFGKLGYGNAMPMSRGHTASSMGDALPAVSLGAGRTAVSLTVGSDVTCSLLDNGSVKCWGYNGYGATGVSDPTASGISTAVAPLPSGRRATAVGAGSGYGFALLDDGSLGYWGQGFAQYGFVAGERFRSFDRSPRYDSFHVCALLESGAVRCWPGNSSYADPQQYGPLGWAFNVTLPLANYPFTQLGTGRTATAIATGESHTCALLDDARLKCWGRNDHGQLGLGDTLPRGRGASEMGDALPFLPFKMPVRAIAAGGNHTCALFDGGVVKCWGLNDKGQLGQGHTEDVGDQPGELEALLPIDLGPGRSAVSIDVGSHSCALLDNGGIKCWGSNGAGELGQGDTLNRGETPGSLGSALKEIDVGG